jgi:hypothetical protein
MSAVTELRPPQRGELIKLVVVQPASLEERTELLEWLARNALDLPAKAVPVLAEAFAHDSLHGPRLEAAWQEYLERLAIADDADRGCLDYHLVAPDLTCGNRTEIAGEIARQDAADALALLAGGSTATTGGRDG